MGSTREYQVLEDAIVPVRSLKGSFRGKLPPWGIFGGRSARVGDVFVNGAAVADGIREVFLKAGDVVRVQTNAGGGLGDPFERDPELVLGDVMDGYVTMEAARNDYGVVINADTFTVDAAATRELRGLLAKTKAPSAKGEEQPRSAKRDAV
jgi:N-methylhydantoinase B